MSLKIDQIKKIVAHARNHPDSDYTQMGLIWECSPAAVGNHIRAAKKIYGDNFYLVESTAKPKSQVQRILAEFKKTEGFIDPDYISKLVGVPRARVTEVVKKIKARGKHSFTVMTQGNRMLYRYDGAVELRKPRSDGRMITYSDVFRAMGG